MINNTKIFIGVAILLIIVISSGVFLLKKNPAQNKLLDTPSEPELAKTKTISIASTPLSFVTIPLFVAQKKGFFEQNGLTVEIKQVDPTIAPQALISKEIDYSPFSIGGIASSQKDLPVKLVFALTEKSLNFLGGKPDVKIQNIKKIGVAKPLSVPHYQALKFIAENNLSAQISFMDSSASVMAQLIKGAIDVGVVKLPTAFFLKEQGLAIIKPLQDDFVEGAIVATNDKIKNNPEEIKKVIVAIQSAINFIKTNPEETKDLLFDYCELDKNEINRAAIEEIYLLAKDFFLDKGIPKDESIIRSIQFAKLSEAGTYADIEKQTVTPEEITKSFDFEFLK